MKTSYSYRLEGRSNWEVVREEIDDEDNIVDTEILEIVGLEKIAAERVSKLTGEPVPEHLRWDPKPKGPPDLLGFYAPLVRKGIFKGVNLAELVERFWRLESMRVDARCSVPEVRWHAHSFGGGAWGRAHIAFRFIHLRLSAAASIEEAVEVLLHEIVHCACPMGESHGELFRRRLIGCAREAFGLDLDTAALLALPAKYGRIAYAIDDEIVKAMTAAGVGARLREDVSTRFEPAPVESEEQVAAKRAAVAAARVAERAEHARSMLDAWERRLKAAQKRAAKWRAKVRYYDRKQEAAKRRTGAA